MRRLLLLCVMGPTLVSACSTDKGFGQSEEVYAADYGAAWPLTVESALLTCDPAGTLLIQIDGHTFGLERAKGGVLHPNFERVWSNDASRSGDRKDLAPLVEDAQELCE